MRKEKYRVVIREKITQAIVKESGVFSNADSWISANIYRDDLWSNFKPEVGEKEDYEIEILDLTDVQK